MRPGILSVAYPFAEVGPAAVGGAEQVLTSLEAELTAHGYRSLVVAREGSKPTGRLFGTRVPDGVITEEVRAAVTLAHQAGIDAALATGEVDLVHMHGIDFDRYCIPAGFPVLVTLHLPPSWYPETIWQLPPNYHLQCVSQTQREACPPGARERLAVVENGVALPDADRLPKRRDYALMLSRICPEKNLHAGLEAARLAQVAVLLAGQVFPYESHLQYMREEIEPRLGDRARFLGPVGGAEKTRLLARARCLLLPTLAPETSSLVAMEALAVGTPVVAYASGAIPEIVEHGRTGFLVADVPGMASAIGRTKEISNAACRASAAERFPLSRMVEGYEALYGRVLSSTSECKNPAAIVVPDATRDEADPPRRSGALAVSVLRATSDLEALLPEWAALWAADLRATPFQSPAWLLPWWKQLGEGELHVLSVREGRGRLVGLLPLYIYTQPDSGERHLLLLGAGTSDYLGGLFAATAGLAAEEIAAAAFGEITDQERNWDRGFLHQLRADSPLLAAARRLGEEVFLSDPCSSVRVAGWGQLPAKIRLNSGRYRRRSLARGDVSYRVATTADSALSAFEDLVALHAKRWQDHGVLTSAAVQRHHRESIPWLLEAGLLSMLTLRIGGSVVAVLYALTDAPGRRAVGERRMYSYLIGFDPAYADLSPGTLLLSYAFDLCEAEGVALLDLLRGGEGYKQLWGAVAETTFGIALPGTPREMAETSGRDAERSRGL